MRRKDNYLILAANTEFERNKRESQGYTVQIEALTEAGELRREKETGEKRVRVVLYK